MRCGTCRGLKITVCKADFSSLQAFRIFQANMSSINFGFAVFTLRSLTFRRLLRWNGWHCVARRLGVPVRENTLVALVAGASSREPTRPVMVERAFVAFLTLALEVELAQFARLSDNGSLG